MAYIENHCRMVSRTTDDYARMALTGCIAVTESASWPGYDRLTAEAFDDYFHHLTEVETARAAKFGIHHYTWIGLNPRESENRKLAGRVLQLIPRYLDHPTALGIGEIGLNRVTRNEFDTFVEQLELASDLKQLVLIHTPHMEDKDKGTILTLKALREHADLPSDRVLIDHVEEHTIEPVLDAGFWAGISLYPVTGSSPERGVDMIERYGPDRLVVSSSGDWGVSDPLAVPKLMREMRRRGHPEELVRKITFDNPARFLGQSPKFDLRHA